MGQIKLIKMKKLFLLLATGAFAYNSASAQAPLRMKNDGERNVQLGHAGTTIAPKNKNMKTTAPGTRNYDHQAYVESISSPMSGTSYILWHDSTVRQNFTSGLGTVNFSSVAQAIAPFDDLWNDPSNPNFLGQIKVTSTDDYVVDSVNITGFYAAASGSNPAYASASIVDTLIISVAYQPVNIYWFWRKATSSWVSTYTTKDTLKWHSPVNVDSITRYAKSYPFTGTSNVMWKQPLKQSDREILSSTSTFKTFSYKLPSPLTVPAGNVAVVSYTFKTGVNSYAKNVDTVTQLNHFRAGYGYIGTSSASTPMTYYWYSGDHSGSSMMFSTDSNFYTPSLVIGAVNDPTAWYGQYLLMNVAVSCATCDVVKTADGGNINETAAIKATVAYPNPANTELNIPVVLKENANVNVTITNMLGQVVATQNLGNVVAGQEVKATFATSNLSAGMYMYTINANGQHITNRFTVAH